MRTEIMNDIIGKEMGNEMDGGLNWFIAGMLVNETGKDVDLPTSKTVNIITLKIQVSNVIKKPLIRLK